MQVEEVQLWQIKNTPGCSFSNIGFNWPLFIIFVYSHESAMQGFYEHTRMTNN